MLKKEDRAILFLCLLAYFGHPKWHVGSQLEPGIQPSLLHWKQRVQLLKLDHQGSPRAMLFKPQCGGKESACSAGDRRWGFDPWIGKIPEEEMPTHSSILAWRIPRTEEPGGLQSVGPQRVRRDWATERAHRRVPWGRGRWCSNAESTARSGWGSPSVPWAPGSQGTLMLTLLWASHWRPAPGVPAKACGWFLSRPF